MVRMWVQCAPRLSDQPCVHCTKAEQTATFKACFIYLQLLGARLLGFRWETRVSLWVCFRLLSFMNIHVHRGRVIQLQSTFPLTCCNQGNPVKKSPKSSQGLWRVTWMDLPQLDKVNTLLQALTWSKTADLRTSVRSWQSWWRWRYAIICYF